MLSKQLFVFDGSENLLQVLDNVGDSLAFDNPEFEEDLEGLSVFKFDVAFNNPYAKDIKEGYVVGFFDGDIFQAFEIIEVHDDIEAQVKNFTCEHVKRELLDDFIEDRPIYNQLPAAALAKVLEGTRWQVGIVTVPDKLESIRPYRQSVSATIVDELQREYGGEFVYRLVVAGSGIVGRFVDWLDQRGTYTGKRFESDKDIDNFERTVLSADIKTAVYVYGRSEELADGKTKRTGIKNVSWSRPLKPVNKPLGQSYIGDPEALERFGRKGAGGIKRHRFGVYESAEASDGNLLMELGYAYLQTVNKPVISYRMKVSVLSELTGYDHEKFSLGDTVAAIETNYKPALILSSRIVSYKRHLLDPKESTVILETVQQDLARDMARLKKLEQLVIDRQGVWDGSTGASTVAEYKVDTISTEIMTIDFTTEYATEPAAFIYVYGADIAITPEFIKGPAESGEGFAYKSIKLTFDATVLGKRFSMMIMGE